MNMDDDLPEHQVLRYVFANDLKKLKCLLWEHTVPSLLGFRGIDVRLPVNTIHGERAFYNTTTWNPLLFAIYFGFKDVVQFLVSCFNHHKKLALRRPFNDEQLSLSEISSAKEEQVFGIVLTI